MNDDEMRGIKLLSITLIALIVALATAWIIHCGLGVVEASYNSYTEEREYGGELGNHDGVASTPRMQARYTSHAPIRIDGNDDFTAENGVVSGSGTQGDPYIIEGWDIDASGADGIEIENTDAYFIIRNCVIHDGYEYGVRWNDGVSFYSVQNGTIENVTSYNNSFGILLYSSLNNNMTSSQIYNNDRDGIWLYSSSNNNLTSNRIYNNDAGILLWHSSNNNLTTNHIYNNNQGIYLLGSSNNNLTSNQIYNNYRGIQLDFSSNNTITSNQVYDNSWEGIWLYSSSNNNMTSNEIYNNSRGIYLKSSSDNEIHYNNIYNNDKYGVYNYNLEPQYVANATYCWWGDASAPYDPSNDTSTGGDYNPDGTGDNVTDNVVYRPWLSAPWGENQPPTADFTYSPSSSTTADTIAFTDISTDSDGTLIAWHWSFGDGANSTLSDPTHKYAKRGNYTVNLTVWDDDNAVSSYTLIVNVVNSRPMLINGTISPARGDKNTEFEFSVIYTDIDGDAPRYVRVVIGNVSYNLTKVAGNVSTGARYEYKTKLQVGDHTYYFVCDDGTTTSTSGASTANYTLTVTGGVEGGRVEAARQEGETFLYTLIAMTIIVIANLILYRRVRVRR